MEQASYYRNADECSRCGRLGVWARGFCAPCYSVWHRRMKGRKTTLYPIVCEFCGASARVTKRSVRCCSWTCAQRARSGWSTSTAVVPWVAPPRPKRKFELVSVSSGRVWVAGDCRRCGESFVIVDQTENRYCSARCLKADGKDRRRALKRAAYVEDVWRSRVFDRDGWRCQICRKLVARTKAVPHPKAPTLDHIVPLAAGGTHEPANVQCAHFLCNSRKNAGAANDQLRLIG